MVKKPSFEVYPTSDRTNAMGTALGKSVIAVQWRARISKAGMLYFMASQLARPINLVFLQAVNLPVSRARCLRDRSASHALDKEPSADSAILWNDGCFPSRNVKPKSSRNREWYWNPTVRSWLPHLKVSSCPKHASPTQPAKAKKCRGHELLGLTGARRV